MKLRPTHIHYGCPTMKTVRFAQLVDAAGRPELKLLWGAPEKDAELQKAIKAGRVLTIHQSNVGQKKDYGTVGFVAEKTAQYLIFPKSLKKFAGDRVVGIKYDEFESAKLVPAKSSKEPVKKAAPPSKKKSTEELAARLAQIAKMPAAEDVPTPQEAAPTRPTKRIPEKEPAPLPKKAEPAPPLKEWLYAVRAAIKDLEDGKAVPALRKLEMIEKDLSEAAD